jgi:hypothetical protein
MGLTLLEASKFYSEQGEYVKSGIIEQFASGSPILDILPFEELPGGMVEWYTEGTLPATQFRGINEAYANDTGTLVPNYETVAIMGGDLDIDTAIVKTKGARIRTVQEGMKLKALQSRFHATFLNGDQSTNPKEFTGLRKRAFGTQLVNAGSTSGGDVLSLSALDIVLSRVRPISNNAKLVIYSNITLALRLAAAARNPTVSGYVIQTKDMFGMPQMTYQGIPWRVIEQDYSGTDILPFTEANPGGGTPASTSIYVVAMSDSDLTGVQTGGIEVDDLGKLQTTPAYRTRLEWLCNIAAYNPRSFARLQGIKDGAIVV